MNIFDCPRPEHPNPQWERSTWRNLNGKWMFEVDNGKSGENRLLQNADTLKSEIIVPFCPESELSGIGEKDFMWCVWYKKEIEINTEDIDGKCVMLHFGAADFLTKVWINGASAGYEHKGGFAPFSYDITKLLKVGKNLITVVCYDETKSHNQPRGKQCDFYYSRGCHYTRTTGIWQTVWLEFMPTTHIKHARILPDLTNSSVVIDAELCGRGDLTAEAYYEGRLVGSTTKKNLSWSGALEIKLTETHAWELGYGRLYDLVLRFGRDEVKSYFGLRSVSLENNKFMLNGKSVFQRLVLDQGYYADGIMTAPSEEALIKDIEISMAAGYNGARLHQKVFEPRFLYHADRLGYMVWGEYGNWGIDPSYMENLPYFLPEWCEVVERDYNHPAIIGWCPFNETWYYGDNSRTQDDNFIRIVYEQTKLLDKTRPCIDSSGGYHVVTDIYDVHNYQQNPNIFKETYDKIINENFLYDDVNVWFSKKKYWGGEPIFISEYGGIGLNLKDADKDRRTQWSYGSAPSSEEEFIARYKGLTDVLLDNPQIFGFCYTQLTDVEQEVNGLYTFNERKPKVDIEAIRKINQRKAAVED